MAIILFSISEASKGRNNKIQLLILAGLSILTIIDNGIALSAIIFRIVEFGITPNRIAVLGSNILMFLHLITIAYQLLNLLNKKSDILAVENTIAKYLPLYTIWAAVVVFLFPNTIGNKNTTNDAHMV